MMSSRLSRLAGLKGTSPLLLSALVILFPLGLAERADAASVSLQIGEPGVPPGLAVRDRPDSIRPSQPETWLVVGRLSMPDLSVADADHVRLQDAEGRVIPLIVESNTLYREFGEIIGMRVAFEFDPRALSGGLPLLSYGPESAATNRLVPEIAVPPDAAGRIRSFTVSAGGTDQPRFATIEIIADSQADTYYLWYLLPMVVIFALLIIRKKWKT